MRMNVAKACLIRFTDWTQSEAADSRERRNKVSTFRELQEMLDMLSLCMANIKAVQAMIYPDKVDCNTEESKKSDESNPTGKITLTADNPDDLLAVLNGLRPSGRTKGKTDQNQSAIRKIVS